MVLSTMSFLRVKIGMSGQIRILEMFQLQNEQIYRNFFTLPNLLKEVVSWETVWGLLKNMTNTQKQITSDKENMISPPTETVRQN